MYVLLLLLSLYLPSSFGGNPSKIILGISYALVFAFGFFLMRRNHADWRWFPVAALIPALIAFFTFWSGLTTYALGALLPFSALAFVLLVRRDESDLSTFTKRVFIACNIANIVLGFGMITGWANGFIGTWYAAIDADFVSERMLALNKPVLSFYVHSVAAFMLYLFFYLNLRSFSMERRRLYGWFCFFYLILIAALLSTTSSILFCIASAQLAFELWRTRHRFVLSLVAISLLLLAIQYREPIADAVKLVSSVQEGGFSARYNINGEIGGNFRYLVDHPFSPIGASGREGIRLGDSGPLDYMLRGSLPLTFLIYGGYFWFLRKNLRYKQDFLVILVATLGFELAASILTYYRFLLLIPFVCVYLNSLPAVPVIVPKKVRWWMEVAHWSVTESIQQPIARELPRQSPQR